MKPILVTFALSDEARPFRAAAEGLSDVHILVTGVGRANAEKAIRPALTQLTPGFALTCGYAGALDPILKIGDLVVDADADFPLREKLAASARPVKFFCSERVLVTAAEKARARAETGAQAVEMESEPIRRLCRAAGIPSATLRAISDLAGEDFPLDFNRLSKPDQNLDPAKLAWAIAKSPGAIPALLRLRQNTRLAAAKLARALRQIISPA